MNKKIKYLTIFFLFIIYIYVVSITYLPKEITVFSNEKINLKSIFGVKFSEIAKVSKENVNKTKIEVKLFGLINVKEIDVTTIERYEVVPIGKVIGLKLYTNGVLIVGMTEIENTNNIKVKPYGETGIREGDTIIKVNDKEIGTVKSLQEAVNASKGMTLGLTILRDGKTLNCNVTPAEVEKNQYKLGLWVKDAATGVGTITFYDQNSESFGALGHGITDPDTDKLIDIDSGEVVTSKIISIQKSEAGEAGEIRGSISGQTTIGEVHKNTKFGIYGSLTNFTKLNVNLEDKVEVALRNEIELGNAKIICTLEDGVTKKYDIKIEKIFLNNNQNNKSMQIKITDEELLQKTGGIIRGLSGAPIIQNNKFVGAVTNVLVNEPDRRIRNLC